MKILSIDFGIKKMGFAYGSEELNIAVPVSQYRRTNIENDIEYIKKLINDYDIDKIIIGYPLNMDGTKSEMAINVERFIKKLRKKINNEVELIDERLTSFDAFEHLKEPDYKFNKKKKIIDSMSALLILKDYLEKK